MKIFGHGGKKLRRAETRDGAKVIIINRKRVLLLKRRNVPFIVNPGIWSFVGGGRDKDETYTETAYREVLEETGIGRHDLELVNRPKKMMLMDVKRPDQRWYNVVFIFLSRTGRVRLDIENAGYRWATTGQLKSGKDFTNEFVDKKGILRMIDRAVRK
jgi:8-oxo-dGTP pyrophosphatase MutT (NUDIX family)